ncbi:MAG: copper amine oxidase N-terminal domain-containing protein [Candidatus Ornithomonoglobus sp.]
MKTNITLTAMLCAASLSAASALPAAASGPNENMMIPAHVEIELKVGESIISVNGEEIEVAAPYIVGEGVTLVPLRVITEAFGAEVEWDADTQSIALSYPDVDMLLRIGSKSVLVNTHTEELEEAAELHNGTTMVPLRFISETFGAEVEYDEDTQRITVIKTASEDGGTTLAGTTDKDYIGDSYYGWTMKNPKSFTMEDGSFDGSSAYFHGDDGSISIYIEKYDEEQDARAEFNSILDYMSDSMLSIADMEDMGGGITKLHFRGKSSYGSERDVIEYVSGKKTYTVSASASSYGEEPDTEELFDITSSFSITDNNRDYYDISSIEDGKREFADEDYKLTVKLPASWYDASYGKANVFSYYDNDNEAYNVTIGIYSVQGNVSAAVMAESDRRNNMYVLNPDISVVGDVVNEDVNGTEAWQYTITCNGAGVSKYIMRDIFFTLGDYVYNFSITAGSDAEINEILSGITAEELDSEETGTIIREADLGYESDIEFAGGKVTVSKYWTNMGYYFSGLYERRSGAMLMEETTASVKDDEIEDKFTEYVEEAIADDNVTAVDEIKTETAGGRTIYSQTFKHESEGEDDMAAYATIYAFKESGKTHYIVYVRADVNYGSQLDGEVDGIVKSISYEK